MTFPFVSGARECSSLTMGSPLMREERPMETRASLGRWHLACATSTYHVPFPLVASLFTGLEPKLVRTLPYAAAGTMSRGAVRDRPR